MPVDPSRPPKPSWREPIKPKDRRPEAQKAWRKESVAAKPNARRLSKKALFGISFIGLLVCAALIVKLLLMIFPPKGAALVLIGAGYEENLAIPHNVYGMQGLNDLGAIAQKGPPPSRWSLSGAGDLRLHHGPQTISADESWTKGWDAIDQKTVLIFLALHGGADSKGAYLLLDAPGGHKPLYISSVIDHLAAKFGDKRIVLILDPTQATENWSLGMLHNDFVRQLRAMEPEIKKKHENLVILVASDEDQRSWVSEEWRQTIFTHFVAEGLRGGACKGDSRRVTAKGLYDFVQQEVKNWALVNRDALQTPILIDPNQKAEGIELEAIAADYTPANATDITQARGREFKISDDLQQAWMEYQDLAEGKTGFSPAFHSPHRWREYGETLLRYEQLLRAGDPTGKAASLRERLRGQRGQMLAVEAGLQSKLQCVSNALPLPLTFGRMPFPEGELKKRFDALFNEEPARRFAHWKETQDWAKSVGPLDLLKIRFGDLLLGEATEDPEKSLKKVHELAQVIFDPSSPPPVEIHFASLLDRDMERPLAERVPLIKRALNLERQAEEVALAAQPDGPRSAGTFHPYSEWVYSWISDDVTKGDEQRRLGNDLLASSHTSDRDKAISEYFKNAEERYHEAAEIAKVVRNALTARDVALAELPVFTRYAGRRDGAHGVDDAEIKIIETLWMVTYSLADLLDVANPANRGANWRGQIENLTDVLRSSLADQRKKYREVCETQEDRLDILPRNWREIEESLSIPYLPTGGNGAVLRMTLLKNSRKISDGLNSNTNQKGTAVPMPLSASDRAKRQGRLVLAMLGKKWVDDQAAAHLGSMQKYDDLHGAIDHAGSGWEATLNQAGQEIGECWRRLPERIQEHVAKSLTIDAKEAQPELHNADRLARQIDAAGAARLSGNPADEYRRLRLQELLLWLGDRTVHDHWWSENKSVDPFYYRAGQAFLNDSKQIALSPAIAELPKEQRNKRVDTDKARQLESVLVKQGLDVTKTLNEVSWTDSSDPNIVLSYRVKAPVALRPGLPGFPMARLKPNPRLKLVDPDKQGWTVVDQFNDQKPEALLEYRVRLADDREEKLDAELEVLYRGERIDVKTPIRIFRNPDTIVRQHEVPNTGVFTARVDEKAYQGSLVIILDCSGSMLFTSEGIPADVKTYGSTTSCRYHRATSALGQVLPKIFEGTQVTVLVFGHERGRGHHEEFFNGPWHRGNVKQLSDLMTDLERQKPAFTSPIVNTMVMAQEKYLKDAPGAKTMLVLTDGLDNDVDTGKPSDADKTKEALKAAFLRTDTFVNVVFFEINEKEKVTAWEQFSALDSFSRKRGNRLRVEAVTDDKAKTISDEKTSQKLAEEIRLALRPRYWVQDGSGNNVTGVPEDGVRATFLSETGLGWRDPLKPGVYHCVLQNGSIHDIQLDAGDRLATIIDAKDGGVVLKRMLISEYLNTRGSSLAEPRAFNPWLLSVLQNGRVKKGMNQEPILQMTVSLEDMESRTIKSGSLHVVRPRFIWWELAAFDTGKRLRLHWGNLTRYTAPAWSLEAPDWNSLKPEPEHLLRAWIWKDAEPKPAETLPRDVNKPLAKDFQKLVQFDNQEVQIESVGFEIRNVEAEPDRQEKRNCLVVRARHTRNHPVMIKLGGNVKPAGAEHYYYDEAAKYTAIFWGPTEDQVNDRSFALDVISIDAVKKNGMPVEMKQKPPDMSPRP